MRAVAVIFKCPECGGGLRRLYSHSLSSPKRIETTKFWLCEKCEGIFVTEIKKVGSKRGR